MAEPWRGGVLGSVQQQQDAQGPYVTGLLGRLIGLGSESGQPSFTASSGQEQPPSEITPLPE
jgi:hypothetical protein